MKIDFYLPWNACFTTIIFCKYSSIVDKLKAAIVNQYNQACLRIA